ncbi:NapC/NirT family cytochrome c [Vibrio aestuarianus]|uniref:Cytochrome c-type protein n=1 Tax=Vibrio aestuarianus TaxID=28171 RepID=A0A9X4J120_9VIBR|nr:NapC/NirT family cytochrome c [Vibrio aestuarianus]MDE1310976.1 NapC/NirT family cytochrome c [Vibrio aestuarianus]MDE1358143.1 NapC/NirT family cytochrome c [Vibrio aestuarianus]NGZ93945.1 cytochrome C [Vibrio aestuarianus subsp. cardii]
MNIKKRTIVGLLAIGVVIGWLSLGGTHAILEKTSSTEFCLSCHTMDTPFKEYQGSVHFSNAKGIRAECADCHIPTDTMDYLITKIRASKDIYHEFITKKISTDEKYEAHRAEMAETVWAQLKANDSVTCRSCHNEDAMETFDQTAEAQKMHQYGIDNNQTCIDCHKGVAHILPEVKMDSQALAHLVDEASLTPLDSSVVYAMQATSMGDLGTINPATPLKVLKGADGVRTIELTGYQMQGAEQVLYMGEGKRAVIAMLTEAGQQKLSVGTYNEDDYGNSWRQVTLEAQIDTPVLGKIDSLWAYAEQLDNVYCSTCHAKIPSNHFTVNAWPSVAKSMGDRTSITKEDLEILTKYFQYNAKDVVAQ